VSFAVQADRAALTYSKNRNLRSAKYLHLRTLFRGTFFAGITGLAATAVVGIAVLMAASRPAQTQPAYAQKAGLECASCHQNPKGGGTLTDFGTKYLVAGLKLPKGYRSKK
jgi:hypothetical protein